MSDNGKMWGARFEGELDPQFAEYQDSLQHDISLAFADLDTNLAWSEALVSAGVLTDDDFDKIATVIEGLAAHWHEHGIPSDSDAEDVHSFVEQQLVAKLGDLGKRIHTGRSRNDQVATDIRLWLREAIDAVTEQLTRLQQGIVELAAQHAATVMPGFTH